MLRRLILIGLFVLIRRGSLSQLIAGSVYCLFHLLAQCLAAPYRELHDDFLAHCSNFALCILFLALIVFRVSTSTGASELQAVLSLEQQRSLHLDPLLLTAILIASLAASAFVSAALLAVEMRGERRRLQSEARETAARRLRYVDTNREVMPPRIEVDEYHLFLSHVWSTGQDQMRIVKDRLCVLLPELVVFLDVDDLTHGSGAEFVDRSRVVLVFVSVRCLVSTPTPSGLCRPCPCPHPAVSCARLVAAGWLLQ